MKVIRTAAVATSITVVLGGGAIATSAAASPDQAGPSAAGCSTTSTPPTFEGRVPTAKQVLGFELGAHETTARQVDRYLTAVDRASDRVVSGTFARTAKGTPLKYALLSTSRNVRPAQLTKIMANLQKLRDPSLPPGQAQQIEQRMPVMLWLSGNVHGNEAAAADAGLKVLYELADRSDCVATKVRTNAVVGFIPTQNPDGRTADTRTNSYAFDMNRDWITRTQPETKGKLDLLEQYPPQLYIDEHGQGGTGYFFPPNSDPIYHETTNQSINWIDNVYGQANAAAFDAKGFDFETYQAGYDLFFQGYGDSSPTTRFGAAGMTFEVGGASPYEEKTLKHYVTGMASIFAGATDRERILTDWHRGYTEGQGQGNQCALQPNQVYNPGHQVEFPVPDIAVCGYFLRSDDPAKARDLAGVVRRLQQADVDVYRLTRPVHVPDYVAYGRQPGARTMPTGTYWIPMNQQQNWIQAVLNENTYVPFPYFYDVSAWSEPLLSNLAGGYTSSSIEALRTGSATQLLPLQKVPAMKLPQQLPRIGILSHDRSPFRPSESAGWLRWRLDQDWRIPETVIDPSQVTDRTLSQYDVLLVPDGSADTLSTLLGDEGRTAVRDWVQGGGHYVGWQGGAQLAAMLDLSTAVLANPTGQAPGTIFRVEVAADSPLTTGVGDTDWVMFDNDSVMTASDPAHVVASYPAADSPDWFVSGYQEGEEELGGTAAEVSEPVGTGDVTVFASDPNFRAWTSGTAKLLYNAIMDSRGVIPAKELRESPAPRIQSTARASAEARARAAAGSIVRPVDVDLAVRVPSQDAAAARRVLARHASDVRVTRADHYVSLVVPGGAHAPADPAPWVRALPAELAQAGVSPIDISTP